VVYDQTDGRGMRGGENTTFWLNTRSPVGLRPTGKINSCVFRALFRAWKTGLAHETHETSIGTISCVISCAFCRFVRTKWGFDFVRQFRATATS
jgi:hypothetical protein